MPTVTCVALYHSMLRYRFAEVRYHRPEEQHKGRVLPARVETVLIFLPDVWSCCPSRIEWDGLAVAYKRQLAEKCKDDQAATDTQALIYSFTVPYSRHERTCVVRACV